MFKNKAEREAFLKDYKSNHQWQVHLNTFKHKMCDGEIYVATIGMWTHQFKNGAIVSITECAVPVANGECCRTETRYNLIIPETDNYNPFDQHGGRTSKEFDKAIAAIYDAIEVNG